MLDFYKGKKVFVTGHTGFKGSWLCYILFLAGADVTGYSLESSTNPSLFEMVGINNKVKSIIGDIRDYNSLKKAFDGCEPEVVFHLAAQPLVREGYNNPRHTYDVNVMGTVNILECVRNSKTVKSFINITTDKVYDNNDIYNHHFKEDEKLDGYDPYSNSKSCSEIITHSYKKSFLGDVPVSTARAGNVIGGGDFSKDRIIPDCVKSIMNKDIIYVRNPYSVRPYQHVLEPLYMYLKIAQMQYENSIYQGWYNIGPNDEDSVRTCDLINLFIKYYGDSIRWIDKSDGGPHESNYLRLDTTKIKQVFNYIPKWNIEKAVEETVKWYETYLTHGDIESLMIQQIRNFFDEME